MSVSNKVLRKMKRVMGMICASVVSAICASQGSFAKPKTWHDCRFEYQHESSDLDFYPDGCLSIQGNGEVNEESMESIKSNLDEKKYITFHQLLFMEKLLISVILTFVNSDL